ncbi:hypothetical protein GQ53DRAFT_847947 [Thozetella sp. PMI_491]|nr:hypothetical protein GQ53DRAFT_847947 [Thozetella sp. PMI_491]
MAHSPTPSLAGHATGSPAVGSSEVSPTSDSAPQPRSTEHATESPTVSSPGEIPASENAPQPTPIEHSAESPTIESPGENLAPGGSPETKPIEYSTDPEVVQPQLPEDGLEVAPDKGMQVVGRDFPEVYYHAEKEHFDAAELPDAGAVASQEPSKPRRRRKMWFLIGIALVVVIAAVLGGVLGSRANQRSSESAPATTATQSTQTSTTQSEATPNSIAANSPLSAISFHTTADASPAGPIVGTVILISFLAPDGTAQLSIYNPEWTSPPQALTTTSLTQEGSGIAMAGYELADRTILPNGTADVEYTLHLIGIYVNKTGYLNGLDYSNLASSGGIQPQAIGAYGYSVRTGSNVAAYWPWFIFQDYSGDMNLVQSLSDPPYDATRVRVQALHGSKFSIVPLSTNFAKINVSSFAIVYQLPGGNLAAIVPYNDTVPATPSWPDLKKFPEIVMPLGAGFSAFSFARSNNSASNSTGSNSTASELVTTFILYQDESSRIKQTWTDDSITWKQSSPSALAVADNGTAITCLTPSAMNDTYGGNPLYLAPKSSLTRCYFQRNRWIVEVQLNGTDWDELGTVPMP